MFGGSSQQNVKFHWKMLHKTTLWRWRIEEGKIRLMKGNGDRYEMIIQRKYFRIQMNEWMSLIFNVSMLISMIFHFQFPPILSHTDNVLYFSSTFQTHFDWLMLCQSNTFHRLIAQTLAQCKNRTTTTIQNKLFRAQPTVQSHTNINCTLYK